MKRIIILLSLLCVFVVVVACSGTVKLDKIFATDDFSGIRCEIPLEIPYAIPTSEFLHTNDSIEELKLKLDKISRETGNFSTEYLPYNDLMIQYSENDKHSLYILHEFTNSWDNRGLNYKHSYRFSDFSALFYAYIPLSDGRYVRRIKGIPVPHHLFKEKSHGSYYINEELPVRGSIDQFNEFYRLFQKTYDSYSMKIRKEETSLILENIPVLYEIVDSTDKKSEEIPAQSDQITFTFSVNIKDEPVVILSYNISNLTK